MRSLENHLKGTNLMAVKSLGAASLVCFLFLFAAPASSAQSRSGDASPDPELQQLVNEAARVALAKFKDKNLQEGNLAITLIDLKDPHHPRQASFRGGEPIYPASVVKMFYLATAHRLLEDGKLRET